MASQQTIEVQKINGIKMNEISYRLNHITSRVVKSKHILYLAILLLCLFVARSISNPVNFRWVAVGTIAFLLFLTTLIDVRKGIIATLIFLPFMAFIRRVLYSVSPYTKLDPILLIGPAIAGFIFIEIFMFRRDQFSETIRDSLLSKCVIALFVLFGLQIFNPLQGSVLVGLGGTMYYIIPLMWFYLGRIFIDEKAGIKLLKAVVVIGFIVTIYGIYQTYFGFMAFEEYWIKYGGYTALNIGGIIRAFSTFASASEYALYITVFAVILAATIMHRKKLILLPVLGITLWAILIGGSRGGVFMFTFTTVALLILRLKNLKKIIFTFVLFLFVFVMILARMSYDPTMFSEAGRLTGVLQRQAMGILDPFTPGRTTLPSHLGRVWHAFIDAFTHNPFGYGLGSTTLASMKFGGIERGTELDFSNILVSCGIVGAALYLIILFQIFKEVTFLCFNSRNLRYTVFFAILFVTMGNFLSGANYALVPLLWLLIGWMDKEYTHARTFVEKRK